MATIDGRANTGNRVLNTSKGKAFCQKFSIAFADYPTTTADVLAIANFAKGTSFLALAVDLVTAEGQACTGAIGLYTSAMAAINADGFVAAFNLNGTPGFTPVAFNDLGIGYTVAQDCVLGLVPSSSTANVAEIIVYVYGIEPDCIE